MSDVTHELASPAPTATLVRRSPWAWAGAAALAVAVVAAPYVASPYWLTVLNQIGIAAIGAIGLGILVGLTGQISLGQGGFLAVGAYTSGLLAADAGVPFLGSVAVAVVVTTIVGTLFGIPALRLRGLYLAIATLASQQVVLWVVTHWDAVTGGRDSLVVPAAEVLGFELTGDFRFYWVIVAFVVLAAICAGNLGRSSLGRAFVAIRDQEVAAGAVGVDVFRFKLLAFAVSSAFVGLAGALMAHYYLIVTWERFTLDVSILYLAMIIVGGLGSVRGAILGAAFMVAFPAWLAELGRDLSALSFIQAELPAIEQLIFGGTIVLFLVLEPRGLLHLGERLARLVRRVRR